MEVGTVVHVFVRDVADHQKCAECAKKLYDYQYNGNRIEILRKMQ